MTDIYECDLEYLIASAPGECPFDITADQMLIEMSPRGQWLLMNDADALLIELDDAEGLKSTGHADLFEFTGNRPNFDDWMAAHHPDIGYRWLDQFVVGFANQASRRSFDNDLGKRVLRADRLPRTA